MYEIHITLSPYSALGKQKGCFVVSISYVRTFSFGGSRSLYVVLIFISIFPWFTVMSYHSAQRMFLSIAVLTKSGTSHSATLFIERLNSPNVRIVSCLPKICGISVFNLYLLFSVICERKF